MRAIGLHVFAGGFTLGIRQGGFDVDTHLEEIMAWSPVAKRNLGIKVVRTSDALPDERPELLFGNPPCHGFARTNIFNAGVNHPHNRLMGDFPGVAKGLEPKIAVFDMVPGLLTMGRRILMDLSDAFKALGYSTTVVKFDAADLGLPQHRRRLWIVFHRVALHVPPVGGDLPTTSIGEAIGDLRDVPLAWETEVSPALPTSRYQLDMRSAGDAHGHEVLLNGVTEHLPHHHKYDGLARVMAENGIKQAHRVPDELKEQAGFRGNTFATAMPPWNEPSIAVTGTNRILHPLKHRLLTLRETARLMGYPDWWRFGRPGDVKATTWHFQACGKAVMPTAAAELATWLMESIEHDEPIREPRAYLALREEKVRWSAL